MSDKQRMKRMKKMSRVLGIDINQVCVCSSCCWERKNSIPAVGAKRLKCGARARASRARVLRHSPPATSSPSREYFCDALDFLYYMVSTACECSPLFFRQMGTSSERCDRLFQVLFSYGRAGLVRAKSER